tara:strand:+ start:134 stop:655 length:522 start_codon:yes stop_codon:yes gene_type:complete
MRILTLSLIDITSGLVACLLLFCISHPVLSFGVLMTTPEERVKLDLHRKEPRHVLKPPVSSPVKPVESIIRLDGLVKRHNGPNSLWVNGAFEQKTSVAGVFVDANKLVDSAVFLKFSSESSPLSIKPGQRINLDQGHVIENYLEKVPLDIKTIDTEADPVSDLLPLDLMTETD